MLLVHRLGHGVGNILARVDVGLLDEQVTHRWAYDSNPDGQVPTAEVNVVPRRVRQRRGIVHEDRHDDVPGQPTKTRLVLQHALVHRDVSTSHGGDKFRTAGGCVDLTP